MSGKKGGGRRSSPALLFKNVFFHFVTPNLFFLLFFFYLQFFVTLHFCFMGLVLVITVLALWLVVSILSQNDNVTLNGGHLAPGNLGMAQG